MGGICLELEYLNSRALMKFICKNNHQFLSTGNRIMQGHWCPVCAGQNHSKNILKV